MKNQIIATIIIIVCACNESYSQAKETEENINDPNATHSVSANSSKGYKWSPERKRLWNEHNEIEFNSSLHMSQVQFDNWAAGGDNTFSGMASLFFSHRYHKDRFALEYKFSGRYGLNIIDSEAFKSADEFAINFLSTWEMRGNWSYAVSANIRSQFSPGYASSTEDILKSDFMSPGFIDIAAGFHYNSDDSPFTITLSPITSSTIVVLNEALSNQGINGVDKGKHARVMWGPSARINFEKTFAKDILNFKSEFYTFSNLKNSFNARWENELTLKALNIFDVKLYGVLYYDNLATTPKNTLMQYNYSIGLGLSYTFKTGKKDL